MLFFNAYFIPACRKENIHLTLDHLSEERNNILDHLSTGRNDILGHLGAGRNEKYIVFPVLLPRECASVPESFLKG